jgi:hypothetical protein
VPNKWPARIKEKTMCWRFEMIYNPGKLQSAADTLSRCRPLHMLLVSIDQKRVADSDEELREFLKLDLENGHVAINLVNSSEVLDKSRREYHRFRHDLHVADGVLCYRDGIVVPETLRTKVLIGIHATQQRGLRYGWKD